ncbi:MAG: PAS domain S-box protein [Theionarchaea archaeon]|nr:PAS domain S-box protein [Theionarchaea archaeon]
MVLQESPYTVPLFVAAAISGGIGFYIWRRLRGVEAFLGALIMLAGAEWMLALVLEMESSGLAGKMFWSKMQYVGINVLPTAWVLYSLQYTGGPKWLTRRTVFLFSIVPTLVLVLVFTNDYHGLMWAPSELKIHPVSNQLVKTFSYGFVGYLLYSLAVILISTVLFVKILIRWRHLPRLKVASLLFAAFFPWFLSSLYLMELSPSLDTNISSLGIALASLIVGYSLIRLGRASIVPVARETVIENMSDGVMVLDIEGRIVDTNRVIEQLVGHPSSQLIGQPVESVWPEWALQMPNKGGELVIDQNGGKHIYDVRVSPLTDWRDTLVSQVVVLRDITERKKAEDLLNENEEKFRTIFENANDGIVYVDNKGIILDINEKTEDLLGYRREDVVGKLFYDIEFCDPRDLPRVIDVFSRTMATGELVSLMELEMNHADGSKVFVEVSTRLIRNQGETEGLLSILRDITERKQTEEKIKASLKEKEVLLREIHHRVRNNLQIISSLLSLQSSYMTDDQYAEMLKECQNRIRTMALIHERLYRSDNLAKIDFNTYIESLVHELVRSYGVNTDFITVRIDVDKISLGVDAAIPCGLIINELVSNCMKHAFPGGKGEITVALHCSDGKIELIVKDNGIGIPETLDIRNTETLGLRLVTILTEDQLNGTVILLRDGGTEFRIIFREKIGESR